MCLSLIRLGEEKVHDPPMQTWGHVSIFLVKMSSGNRRSWSTETLWGQIASGPDKSGPFLPSLTMSADIFHSRRFVYLQNNRLIRITLKTMREAVSSLRASLGYSIAFGSFTMHRCSQSFSSVLTGINVDPVFVSMSKSANLFYHSWCFV